MPPVGNKSSTSGPVVLGVNTAHDAAACLLIDGELRVAIAEERLSRRKHQPGSPRRAIEGCLADAGLENLGAVDCIVVNQFPQTDFSGDLRRKGFEGELLVNPSHHLLHAHYAAAASGRPDSAILVVDGSGYSYAEHSRRGSPLLGPPPRFADACESESSFALRAGEIELVERRWGVWDAGTPYFRFPSLGHMFSAASQYIFGHWVHAGKTMGLAPYGDPSGLDEQIVTCGEEGLTVDTEWVLRLPPRSDRPAHLDRTCRDVAAKVQAELERAMLFLARRLFDATGLPHLCLAGGVALNSVANARLREEGPFEEMFVTPAAGDSGTAVGAAVYGHTHLSGEIPSWSSYTDFLGPRQKAVRTERALARAAPRTRRVEPAGPAAAAADIAAGRVVGWYEGRSELGPRALGHRSILCDPRIESIRDYLNERVKFREPFRPYAAAVLEEHAERYFEVDWIDRFMLSVVQIRPEHQRQLRSICHVDGSCRVQTVPPDAGDFRRLIVTFFEETGLPLVLNTSLNVRGEPIVETPEDAIRCFLGSNIDCVYVDGVRLEKAVLDAEVIDTSLVPAPTGGIVVESRSAWEDGGWSERLAVHRAHGGQTVSIDELDASLLAAIDGNTSVGELIADRQTGPRRIAEALASLQERGLISMAYADLASSNTRRGPQARASTPEEAP